MTETYNILGSGESWEGEAGRGDAGGGVQGPGSRGDFRDSGRQESTIGTSAPSALPKHPTASLVGWDTFQAGLDPAFCLFPPYTP